MATSKKKKQPAPLPEPEPTNWYTQVLKDVRTASIAPPFTKQEAMAYFQARYPKNWNYELSRRLQPFLPLTKSGQPQSIKNIERRHQARRGRGIPGSTPTTEAQYRALGASIGYEPPPYGYHINYEGWILFSHCEYRTFQVDIVGEWAKQVAAEPRLVFPAMFLIYMEEDDQERDIDEQSPSVGFCEIPDEDSSGNKVKNPKIDVYANTHEVASGHRGRERRFSFFAR